MCSNKDVFLFLKLALFVADKNKIAENNSTLKYHEFNEFKRVLLIQQHDAEKGFGSTEVNMFVKSGLFWFFFDKVIHSLSKLSTLVT
jgi:hypothetical protein